MFTINFCENNVVKGLDEIINKLKKEIIDAKIEIEPCLGYCSECDDTYFCIADAELILGDTPDELFDNIIEFYEEINHEEI